MKKNSIFEFKDKENRVKGSLEIKNQTDSSCDLYIYGDIVGESFEEDGLEVCPKDVVDFLSEVDDKQELHIYMNSGGGSVFAGIAIGNLLNRKKCHKVCHIDALCASIATVIACSCDEVHIHSNSTFMVHKPMTCFFLEALNADELQKEIDILDSVQKSICNTYLRKAKEGVTEEQLNSFMNKETWFTGEEACEYFDFVLEDAKEMVACATDIFKNAKNRPVCQKEEEEDGQKIDADSLAELITNKILEKKDEARKQALLERIKKGEE